MKHLSVLLSVKTRRYDLLCSSRTVGGHTSDLPRCAPLTGFWGNSIFYKSVPPRMSPRRGGTTSETAFDARLRPWHCKTIWRRRQMEKYVGLQRSDTFVRSAGDFRSLDMSQDISRRFSFSHHQWTCKFVVEEILYRPMFLVKES